MDVSAPALYSTLPEDDDRYNDDVNDSSIELNEQD
jgi:hypothetical protein